MKTQCSTRIVFFQMIGNDPSISSFIAFKKSWAQHLCTVLSKQSKWDNGTNAIFFIKWNSQAKTAHQYPF